MPHIYFLDTWKGKWTFIEINGISVWLHVFIKCIVFLYNFKINKCSDSFICQIMNKRNEQEVYLLDCTNIIVVNMLNIQDTSSCKRNKNVTTKLCTSRLHAAFNLYHINYTLHHIIPFLVILSIWHHLQIEKSFDGCLVTH